MIEEIFTKNNLIYTIKAFISVGLALYISMRLGLDKPIWAMIVALLIALRPQAGFIIEKGILIILVNSIGIIIGMIIITLFLPYPTLAIVSLFIFIAITMYFSANMSHPNFVYALMLSNLTCTVIVLYAIANPAATTEQSIFYTGSSRISEIIIGCLSSFFVNYYIFPVKIKHLLKDHVDKSINLVINYIKDIASLSEYNNNEKYNKQVEEILNSLVVLNNDLTASKYENINNNEYYKLSNNIIDLIQIAHLLRKQTIKNKITNSLKSDLNKIAIELNNNIANENITFTSKNILVNDLTKKLNHVINSYQQTNNYKQVNSSNKIYYRFKNYKSSVASFINILRTISLLLLLSLLWLNSQTSSSDVILMLVLPSAFSQLFITVPNTTDLIKKIIIGMCISIPVSILIVLNLLAQAIGYFEIFILILMLTLFLPIVTLTIPRFQPYSLGFIFGWICVVQPSNHMNFNISHLLTSGLNTLFGCIALWLAFKILPQYPYTIARKLAVKSIIKDRKYLRLKKISEEQYKATIIKKILCIYRNRKSDISSERDIEFALYSLTKST